MDPHPALSATLDQVGPRLRLLREKQGRSLADLYRLTGISTSTLSRLESGQRRPSLELLLPLAAALHVALDDIVAAPRVVDPTVAQRPRHANGRVLVPLTGAQSEPKAYKLTIPRTEVEPVLRTHRGHEWMFVLKGRLRLVLAEHDLVMGPGEAAEFDTEHPHWFGSTGSGRVELLTIFGSHGERAHFRTAPTTRRAGRRPTRPTS